MGCKQSMRRCVPLMPRFASHSHAHQPPSEACAAHSPVRLSQCDGDAVVLLIEDDASAIRAQQLHVASARGFQTAALALGPLRSVRRRGNVQPRLHSHSHSQRDGGVRTARARTASTASCAMRLYVVHLPPRTETMPEPATSTTCFRDTCDVDLAAGSRMSRPCRSPAGHATAASPDGRRHRAERNIRRAAREKRVASFPEVSDGMESPN